MSGAALRIMMVMLALWVSIPCMLRREVKEIAGIPVAETPLSRTSYACSFSITAEKKSACGINAGQHFKDDLLSVFNAGKITGNYSQRLPAADLYAEQYPVFLRNRCLRI